MKNYRFIAYDKASGRMEMDGAFTESDLIKIAEWLKNGDKEAGNWLDLGLSPLTPPETK